MNDSRLTPTVTAGKNINIAISPDYIRHRNGEEQSFSARWTGLAAEQGIRVTPVDAYEPDAIARIRDCDGFMWRYGYDPLSLQYAKRLLSAIEHGLRMPVFPSWCSAWHFEDKLAQHYLLAAAGIPTPSTWILWGKDAASRFCQTARYPIVAKLSAGIQSNNVRLLNDRQEALDLVKQMFGAGLLTLEPPSRLRHLLRRQVPGLRLLLGKPTPRGIQYGYFYAQEFLPNNAFDTRITVIGNRAFGFRRLNRPSDFRASGSGRIDWDPSQIDTETIRLGFRVARTLNTQSVAIDGLRRGEERVVGEISYTYASWAVRDCPGHWVLNGNPESGSLTWVEGQMRPEDAIFNDFIDMLAARQRVLPSSAAHPPKLPPLDSKASAL